MTGDERPSSPPTRRRFLAGVATAFAAATAGCGYVPGGGDLAWRESLRVGSLAFGSDRRSLPAEDRLVTVENQSGRDYDFEEEVWRDVENAAVSVLTPDGTLRSVGETERQAVGAPAVGGDAVFLPLERDRLTAVDLSEGEPSAGGSSEADPAGSDGSTEESADGAVRWRIDAGSLLATGSEGGSGNDGTADGDETTDGDGTADGDETTDGDGTTDGGGSSLRGVRASDSIVVAVGAHGIAAVDAETGDRALAVPDLWTDESGGSPADPTPRVAVDDATVWVLIPGDAAATENGDATVVGYDRTGARRVERAVDDANDWIVAVDGTVAVGGADGTLTGYDRELERRFALDAQAPESRPPHVSGEGRLYYSHGRTVVGVDVDAGEVAFERSDLPRGHLAVDERGAYVAERGDGFDDAEARMVAVGTDGSVRWETPFPEGVEPSELFAIGGRLVALDGGTAYGFRATPGERWSPLG
ncbi:hypothetical protein J2744_000408 [Halorubrum trapanicum]|uniref:Uncharacterized protein n=1 Tax=Halorubrum trapanicum TaxID=29284 RepID=A0A8J7R4G8_9EURY|nr:hypothetical protein [Halorubrum trapanicum]MBP1900756.1 hypothetical protein [Halorubrum trapanicum]